MNRINLIILKNNLKYSCFLKRLFINFYIKSEIFSDILFDEWRIEVKNLFKVLIIALGFVSVITTQSFAIVDAAAWGGYVFNAEMEDNDDADPKGGQYGLKAHYNTSLIPLLELGVGAYYQYSKLKFDLLDSDEDLTRQTFGLDANLILGLPIVHPYLRGTYSFWDKMEVADESDTEKFKGYGAGLGVELTVFPFIRIFGEYMYDYTEHDFYIKSNSINVGLKFDL